MLDLATVDQVYKDALSAGLNNLRKSAYKKFKLLKA